MRESGLEHGIDGGLAIGPFEEGLHFRFQAASGWRLIMHALAPDGTRDNLHRAGLVIPPGADRYLAHAAAAGWEHRSVPGEQALVGQRLFVFLSRVEHHLDEALNLAVGRRKSDRKSTRLNSSHIPLSR